MNNEKTHVSFFGEKPLLFGLAVSIIFTVAGIAILSLGIYFSSISEMYLKPAGSFIYLTGAFLGGFLAAKKAGGKGLVYGVEVGICYYLFFIIVSLFLSTASLSIIALALKGIYTIIISAAGGICGLAFA